jgi:PAS domain S-box-containing protein
VEPNRLLRREADAAGVASAQPDSLADEPRAGDHADEDVYRRLIDAIGDYAIYLLDASGRIRTWNRGAERIKGYTADEVVGRHFSIFFTPEDVRGGRPQLILSEAAVHGRYEDVGWRVRKDGTRFWADVVITAVRDPSGELRGYAKVTRDLTARRAAEKLRASEARLAAIIGSAMDAIISVDTEQRIALFNAAAERMFGISANRAIGMPLELLIPSRFREAYRRVIADFTATGISMRLMGPQMTLMALRSSGEEFPVEGAISQVDVGDEKLLTVILRDISDRRRAEEEREAALAHERDARDAAETALRSRDEFLGIASHELKTPLTAIQLAVSAIARARERGTLDGQRLTTLLGRVDAGARRMATMVSELLDVSRLQRGRLTIRREPVDLGVLVGDVVERYDTLRDGLALRAEPNVIVSADPARIEQVVANLVENALKYSADGAPVAVTVRGADDGAVIEVVDRGIGLDDVTSIFEPFGRGANAQDVPGLGLGLYIARQIVARHRGRLWASSNGRGEGSTFSIWLPVA